MRALKANNISVRALARNLYKAKQLLADDVVRAEVTELSSLAGVMSGVDSVVSCIGITRQRDGFTYDEVDYQGNANLLKCARANSVANFLYVSLFRGKELQHIRIAAAKERFVTLLESSGLNSTIVRPTAFFSDMKDVLARARSGWAFVFGSGRARINPISGRDLADATVDAFLKGSHQLNIGGPQVFTHEEIVTLAFETLGKRTNVWHLPMWTAKAGAQILRAITPVQVYGPVEFFLAVATQDMVAPSEVTPFPDHLSYTRMRSMDCRIAILTVAHHEAGAESRPPQEPEGLGLDSVPVEWYFRLLSAMRLLPSRARILPVFDTSAKSAGAADCIRDANRRSSALRPTDFKTGSRSGIHRASGRESFRHDRSVWACPAEYGWCRCAAQCTRPDSVGCRPPGHCRNEETVARPAAR